MQKTERHAALLSLIQSESIRNQSELTSELSKLGHSVTQASVSRDLDELDITKINGRYARALAEQIGAGFGVVTFATAGDCLIVGRCSPGLASAITVRIDEVNIAEIVGTIAGDDTIFIAVDGAEPQLIVLETLRRIFG